MYMLEMYFKKKAKLLNNSTALFNKQVLETRERDSQWFLNYLDRLNEISVEY